MAAAWDCMLCVCRYVTVVVEGYDEDSLPKAFWDAVDEEIADVLNLSPTAGVRVLACEGIAAECMRVLVIDLSAVAADGDDAGVDPFWTSQELCVRACVRRRR